MQDELLEEEMEEVVAQEVAIPPALQLGQQKERVVALFVRWFGFAVRHIGLLAQVTP